MKEGCGTAAWSDVAPITLNDEALMLEFQAGSRAAFEELYSRYHGRLYGFFRRRLNGDQRAEDLTQDTFLVLIRAAAHYERRSLFRTYLYGIAMNLLLSERRKRAKDGLPLEQASEPSTHADSDAVLWIRQALQKLDQSEREILMLREYEQLSYAEIGALLELPVNTVRSRLFRARTALREQLEPCIRLNRTAVGGAPHETSRLTRAGGEAI